MREMELAIYINLGIVGFYETSPHHIEMRDMEHSLHH